MSETLIKVDGVSKKFCKSLKKSLFYGMQDLGREVIGRRHGGNGELRPDEFWAVKDVSFELKRGECLGLIGRNGAGKTTLLRMLNGLIKPDCGRIEMRGRIGALISLGAGFNPILSGRENIYVNASVLGLSKREITDKLDEIIDFAEIGDFIDMPVQSYSSGMQVRLGFAVATAMNPDILLLDEVLAVGDAAFRSKCFHRIGKLMNKCGVIFVSHDEVQVSRICDYCLYLKGGKSLMFGESQDVLQKYSIDNRPVAYEQSIVLHHFVLHFSCMPSESIVNWGNSLSIVLELECTMMVYSGLSLLTLMDGDNSVVQSDFTKLLNESLQHSKMIQINLGPLYLREGDYSLAVTILDESKKCSLVHALYCSQVHIIGPVGYGVVYQAASSVGING